MRLGIVSRIGALTSLLAMLGLLSPAPALWATDAFQETSGQVVINAERYDAKIPRDGRDWVLEKAISGYSGSGYLSALPNGGMTKDTTYATASPELVYNVAFTTTGTYYVWVRGSAASGTDDSLHAGIDGAGPASADRISGYPTSWKWNRTTMDASAPATLVVSTAGLHTIHFWMREDGFRFDKLLLRKSSSSTAPSGTGPAESPRVTLGPPPDGQAPTGTVQINGGAAATNNPAVSLTLSATDAEGPVQQMRFSNDGLTYSTAETYATSKTWTLSGGDGTKTVWAQYADPAGNWSAPASDAIELDTAPPTLLITSPQDGEVIVAP